MFAKVVIWLLIVSGSLLLIYSIYQSAVEEILFSRTQLTLAGMLISVGVVLLDIERKRMARRRGNL